MKELSVCKLENLEGGKFWGTSVSCSQSYSIEPGSCYQTCTVTYNAFWIPISSTTDVYTCGAAEEL